MPRERSNPPAEELYARRWPIFAVTMIGLFMALVDVTIVNISIPELQRDLEATVEDVSWVLNAYNIMFAVLLVGMGRLADQFGRRTFFITGMGIFTLGSLLCALSASIDALVAFRVVQAVGAGILAPLALATTTLVFPPEQRGLGLAMMAMIANLAAAIGPPLGGVLIEVASWHWIFLINVPIGVAGVVLALRVMPETYDLTASRRVDWLGTVLIAGSVFALTYGLVEANSRGWGSPGIVALLAGSALLAVAFALSQRFGRAPMLSGALVRNRQFTGASVAMLAFAMGMMGMLFLCVLALIGLWGYSELEAAFAITPVAAMGALVAPIVARGADRLAPRTLALPAVVLVVAGLLWLSALPAEPDYLAILGPLIVAGAGIGMMFPAVNIGAMGSIPGQELGLGSGIVNMSRQVGFALGIAVLVAVFTGSLQSREPDLRAEVAGIAQAAGIDGRARERLVAEALAAPGDGGTRQQQPSGPLERRVAAAAADARRDAFAAGFRVAALAVLLALPFTLAMRRRPGEVHVAAAAASAG